MEDSPLVLSMLLSILYAGSLLQRDLVVLRLVVQQEVIISG